MVASISLETTTLHYHYIKQDGQKPSITFMDTTATSSPANHSVNQPSVVDSKISNSPSILGEETTSTTTNISHQDILVNIVREHQTTLTKPNISTLAVAPLLVIVGLFLLTILFIILTRRFHLRTNKLRIKNNLDHRNHSMKQDIVKQYGSFDTNTTASAESEASSPSSRAANMEQVEEYENDKCDDSTLSTLPNNDNCSNFDNQWRLNKVDTTVSVSPKVLPTSHQMENAANAVGKYSLVGVDENNCSRCSRFSSRGGDTTSKSNNKTKPFKKLKPKINKNFHTLRRMVKLQPSSKGKSNRSCVGTVTSSDRKEKRKNSKRILRNITSVLSEEIGEENHHLLLVDAVEQNNEVILNMNDAIRMMTTTSSIKEKIRKCNHEDHRNNDDEKTYDI